MSNLKSQISNVSFADRVAYWCATVGGAGLVPYAPGTVGSLAGLGVWLIASCAPGPLFVEGALIALIAVMGVWAGGRTEQIMGRTDPPAVVIDEVVGMVITLAGTAPTVKTACIGFVLFRLFDILKPFPICRLQRLKGGWGIVADDVAAGMVAAVGVRVVLYLSHTIL